MRYIIFAFFLVISHVVYAQDSSVQEISFSHQAYDQSKKHFIHTELLGRTFVFGSLNYEYALLDKFSVGCGFGLINIQKGEINRNTNGETETGNYLDIASTQSLFGNYFIGKRKHKLLFTGGITNFLYTYRNTYPSEKQVSREAQLEWNAGIGYQFSARKIFFRFTGYCLSLPEPTGWFPKYMPWVGISVGIKVN